MQESLHILATMVWRSWNAISNVFTRSKLHQSKSDRLSQTTKWNYIFLSIVALWLTGMPEGMPQGTESGEAQSGGQPETTGVSCKLSSSSFKSLTIQPKLKRNTVRKLGTPLIRRLSQNASGREGEIWENQMNRPPESNPSWSWNADCLSVIPPTFPISGKILQFFP